MSRLSFSIKFYLSQRIKRGDGKSPLYLRVIVDRRKTELCLYEYIDPRKWDSELFRILRPTKHEQYLNQKLIKVQDRINMIRWELEREDRHVTSRTVIRIFKDGKRGENVPLLEFFSKVILDIESRPFEYSKQVVGHYRQAQYRLAEYLGKINRKDIRLKDFARSHIVEFENFLLTTKTPTLNRPLNRNTTNRYLIKLKVVIQNGIRQELISNDPFNGFAIREVKPQRVILTEQEIEALKAHPLSGNASLIRVRDIFLFSIYTGLRFSDATALQSKNVISRKDRMWIVLIQIKTEVPLEVPMLSQAKEIYDKYEEERQITGYVLPRLSHQKFNTFIKTVAELVGINKNLHHHISRHTFATMMLEKGIDIKTVSAFMGHTSLRATETYAKVTRKLLQNVVERLEADLI